MDRFADAPSVEQTWGLVQCGDEMIKTKLCVVSLVFVRLLVKRYALCFFITRHR